MGMGRALEGEPQWSAFEKKGWELRSGVRGGAVKHQVPRLSPFLSLNTGLSLESGRWGGWRQGHLKPPERTSPSVAGVRLLVSHCRLSSPLKAGPGLGSNIGGGRDSDPTLAGRGGSQTDQETSFPLS